MSSLIVISCPICGQSKISEQIMQKKWVYSCGRHSWLNEGMEAPQAFSPPLQVDTEYRPLADTPEYIKRN